MSAETSKFVQDILDAVRDGLGPFVLRQYKVRYSRKEYLTRLQVNLSLDALEDEAQALEDLDFSAWRKAIEAEWDEIFSNRLGHRTSRINTSPDAINARNFLYELQNARNRWAHPSRNSSFSAEDTFRLADTATRLLLIVKAKEEAERTAAIKLDLGRRVFGSIHDADARAAPVEEARSMSAVDRQNADTESFSIANHSTRSEIVGGNLSGRDLRECNFKSANLRAVNMSRVNLAGVDLTVANLSGATLTHAKLRGACIFGLNLSGANLAGADLRRIQNYSRLPRQFYADDLDVLGGVDAWLVEGIQVRDRKSADANGVTLPYYVEHFVLTDFAGADLQGTNMSGAWFNETYPEGMEKEIGVEFIVSFRNANLSGANLTGAFLSMADFGEADLSSAILTDTDICFANFSGARMTRTQLTELIEKGGEEVFADFSRADLTHALMENSCLVFCEFNDAKLNHANCARTDFSHSQFHGADLSQSVLTSAVLEKANMEKAQLKRADLSNAEMARANAQNADFSQSKLIGAILEGAQLSGANLTKANLSKANLSSANLSGAVLHNADFKEAILANADLTGADLAGANLMDANLESATLKDGKLDKAKFRFTTKLPDGSYWSGDTDLTRFTS